MNDSIRRICSTNYSIIQWCLLWIEIKNACLKLFLFLCVIDGAINVKKIVAPDDLELESLEWNHFKVINHILISNLVDSHTHWDSISVRKKA